METQAIHRVYVFSQDEVKTKEFKNPMDAVKYYYLMQLNPKEQSVINLVPNDVEFNDFFPPKVLAFNGTFVNEYFVGSLTLENSQGEIGTFNGVISVYEVDFGKYQSKQTDTAQHAMIGLKIAGAREIGRNENTCQTFFTIANQMIAVDDLGQISVSKPFDTWNESIEAVLYTYENPYDYENNNEIF